MRKFLIDSIINIIPACIVEKILVFGAGATVQDQVQTPTALRIGALGTDPRRLWFEKEVGLCLGMIHEKKIMALKK